MERKKTKVTRTGRSENRTKMQSVKNSADSKVKAMINHRGGERVPKMIDCPKIIICLSCSTII